MIQSVREFVANLAGALYHREIHWEPKGLIEDRLRDERAKPMPTHEVLAVFDQVLAVHDARVKAEALREHRRRVARIMRPGLVDRATVLADLDDYAARIERRAE